jgi:phospholipid transport system substrate-binding protein|tara:strand:+ start:1698 stop:2300 length:603 start_codon:yes stop_codon:yes gene_type:complete
MKRKIVSFLLFCFILTSFEVKAVAYSSDPEKFISEIIDEAKVILSSGSDQKTKAKKLSDIALKTVDIKGLASYTIGKKRKELSSEELQKYESLFEKYFLKSFTSRLTDYSDPKISVLNSEIVSEKYTIVKTMLLKTSKKPEVKIDWRVYTKNPEKPLIRDLIVEGLSLARTQKEEFSSILSANNQDINVLFETLEKFINQ